ncbi:MAG: metallophosphoesterase family protein [Alphaproteobacteria bacterium]
MSERTFVHLSDLHFGRTEARLTHGLLAELHKLEPEVTVISGDLTQKAKRREFEEAVEFMEHMPGAPFVVPGNHDLPGWNVIGRFLRRFARFRRYIGPEMNPVYQDEDLALVGLNTARTLVYHWNWSHGRVSHSQLDTVAETFGDAPESALRVVVMHHPMAAPEHKPNQKLVGRARRAAEGFAQAQTDMVLTGHLHTVLVSDLRSSYPDIGRSIWSFQGGTSLSDRLRGEPNSFRMFRWSAPRLRTELFEWTGRRFECTGTHEFIRTENGLEDNTAGS